MFLMSAAWSNDNSRDWKLSYLPPPHIFVPDCWPVVGTYKQQNMQELISRVEFHDEVLKKVKRRLHELKYLKALSASLSVIVALRGGR